jgi:NitT/TauT family transport system substrate-binding protein
MRYISQGKDLVAVINTDLSSGVDAIIVKKEIQHIRDLKGKRVGIQNDTYSEYFLDVVLERFGLSLDDVIKVEVPAEKAAEALLQEVADAVITWEPLASEAIKKADARRLFDSSQIPGINAGVMVFHRRFIGERPQDVQAFVNVWQKTVEFIKENPKEAFGIIAKIYGVNPGEAQALAQIDKILDVRDNVTAFSYAAGLESLHGLARRMNDFMVGKGMTEKRLDSTDFLDARFIAALKNKF